MHRSKAWLSTQLIITLLFYLGLIVSVRLSPFPFRGTIPINPGIKNCRRESSSATLCTGVTTLSDGNFGPEHPDLSSNSDNGQFVVWPEGSMLPYMSFEVSQARVSQVDIYLLNYPEELFGVPNFQLYRISQAIVIDPDNAVSNTIEVVEFDLLNNDQLSMLDRTVRRVTLRPRTPIVSAGMGILLRWTFTDLYKVDFLGVSEVLFRSEKNDFTPGTVEFQSPASAEPVILHPSAQMLEIGSLTITCTVASQGSFTWQWRKDGVELNTFSILSSDGTRTSILIFDGFNFHDSGVYSCTAGFDFPGAGSQTRRHSIQFPSKHILSS